MPPSPDFGSVAQRLARNPLGIIALFIVLVYAIAALLFGLSGRGLDANQKWPFVWFLVVFPPLVLAVFYRLVTKHHAKLYAPQDYRNEEHFLRSLASQQQPEAMQSTSRTTQPVTVPSPMTETSAKPDMPPGHPGTEHLAELRAKAEAERLAGDLEGAVRDATQVIDSDAGDVFALWTRAEAYRSLHRFEDAVRDATRVIDTDPGDAFALRTRAEAYRGLNRFEDAVRDATRVIDANPKDVFALSTRASAFLSLGRHEEATVDASSALSLEPGNELARAVLASSLSRPRVP